MSLVLECGRNNSTVRVQCVAYALAWMARIAERMKSPSVTSMLHRCLNKARSLAKKRVNAGAHKLFPEFALRDSLNLH